MTMPPRSLSQRPDRLDALSSTQEGVVSRAQLAQLGYDPNAVARRISSGRWQPAGGAVVTHNGDISEHQLRWIAILTAPGQAVVSGRAASVRFGLRGFPADSIDVLVGANARPAEVDGIRWRRCRRLDKVPVARLQGPSIVVPARALVDAARWTSAPRTACALLAAGVQQRVTTVSALRAELLVSPVIPHRRILDAILADIEGGADSLGEIDFTVLARKAGLPPPIRQSVRLDSMGRRRYLDADFGTFAVEVDGGLHLRAQTYWDDANRQNDLVLGGDRILRFPTIAIRLDEAGVIRQLRRAKAVFG
jgi:putative AbiEi antitoxin of type IV toxin-antitoxin system